MLAICSTQSRKVVESAIERWSLEVGWCASLQEARRSLRRGTHSLILCEAKLPDGTYQDVMRLLAHKLGRVRVIVMSESDLEECYSEAIEMGVFDVHPQKGLTLVEIAPDTTLEAVKKATEAPFEVAADLKVMQV